VFADIAGNVFKEFGLDRTTCLSRLIDLRNHNLADFAGQRLRLADPIVPTSLLIKTYDSHVVETDNALLSTAHALGQLSSFRAIYEHDDELNIVFRQFMAGLAALWSTHLQEYLKPIYPKEVSLRRKILRDLRTAPYWYILFTAWYHGNQAHRDRKPYLLVDDFHMILFPTLGLGWPATRDYVQNLIKWRFLSRISAKQGVPANKFAVEIMSDAYLVIENIFASSSSLFLEAGHILHDFAERHTDPQDHTVVSILRPSGRVRRRNISETSTDDASEEPA
jgi:hypothetical protein